MNSCQLADHLGQAALITEHPSALPITAIPGQSESHIIDPDHTANENHCYYHRVALVGSWLFLPPLESIVAKVIFCDLSHRLL